MFAIARRWLDLRGDRLTFFLVRRYLARWRGIGPAFVKFPTGAVRYDDEILSSYAADNTFQSTTEAQQAKNDLVVGGAGRPTRRR